MIEEVILVDEVALNKIVIPTTNVDRNLPDGTTDPDEVVNQSQIYITSAGWKNSFAYKKLIEILLNSIIDSSKYMILGGDYRLAILEGAVKEDMVENMQLDGTYNEASFEREYRAFVLFKLLRIAGNSLELFKLQHKNEISLSVNVLKIKKIGKSAAKPRREEGSTTKNFSMRKAA